MDTTELKLTKVTRQRDGEPPEYEWLLRGPNGVIRFAAGPWPYMALSLGCVAVQFLSDILDELRKR